MSENDIEDLDPSVDDPVEEDHPDEVTEEEAELGRRMWHEVDDLDDNSNGMPRFR